MSNEKKKKSSHLGSGLMLGAIIGVAAATFLQSKKGKVIKADLQKKMGALQKKLNSELKKAKSMSKERYEALVDNVIDYYVKTKEVAKSEVPLVKQELMSSWKSVEAEMRTSGKRISTRAKSSGKRLATRAKSASRKVATKKKK